MSTPVKFKELTLRNFMSYGNNVTTINLDFKEPKLIIGKNHDATVNGQIDSNGSGKSAIIDALAFVLFDKTISKKDKPNLINNINKKNLEVTITFEKDGKTYKIIRSRKSKTKGDVTLLVSKGKEFEDKTPDSIANTNLEIERTMGLPFDVFSRIIVFSANFQPFLDLPSTHTSKVSQTSIMEELFGYTELSEKADKLKEKIKEVKSEFNHLTELQEQIGREKARHESQIETTKQRIKDWNSNHDEKIKDANDKLKELSKIDIDKERNLLNKINDLTASLTEIKSDKRVKQSELDSLEAQVASAESKKSEIEDIIEKTRIIEDKINFQNEEKVINDISTHKDNLSTQQSKLNETSDEIKKCETAHKKLKNEKASLDMNECPYCHQEYKDAQQKYSEIILEMSTIEENKYEFMDSASKLENTINELSAKIKKLTSDSLFKGSMSELQKMQKKYDSYLVKLESYEADDNLDDIEDNLVKIKSEISKLDEQIESINSEVSSLKKDAQFDDLSAVERVISRIEAEQDKIKYLEAETNPHISALEELKDIKFDEDKSKRINDLDETLKHQEFLLKLLTKKDSFIRKNLLDRSIPFLNKRLMIYLEQLGLPHRVEFQTDMTAKISQFGTELGFSDLSSGQKARVNLALAFAFRDVLQARHGKIAFCMLDECLDTGLGNVGVQLAAKMIKEIATVEEMSMFVISHRDEIAGMFNNQMVVELKNGFSTITQD